MAARKLIIPVIFDFSEPLAVPDAPTLPITNDENNTFDWTYSPSYTTPNLYEFTLNGGTTWATVTTKPISVGNVAKAIGQVGVRVKASGTNSVSAALYNTSAFTTSPIYTPVAPTSPVVDDVNNTFDWTYDSALTSLSDIEYTIDGGTTYSAATAKPQPIPNQNFAINKVGVRYKAVQDVRNSSSTIYNTEAYTISGGGAGAGGTLSYSDFRSRIATAGGTLGSTQESNLETFIDSINFLTAEDSIIYPYVGGTLDSGVLEMGNLQSLVPVGAGYNIDAEGANPVNNSSFFNTTQMGSTFDLMNFTIFMYSNTETGDNEDSVDIGVAGPPTGSQAWISAKKLGVTEVRAGNVAIRTSNTTSIGCFILTVVDGIVKAYKDGVEIASGTITSGTFTPEVSVAIGGANYHTAGYIAHTGRKRICDGLFRFGLDQAQVEYLNDAITTYATNKV